MVKIRKYANGIERFLHGPKGQRFFNFAYSIGAAVVIWGALFKILHLPGGSALLCIGMGTEVAMFILTAFDRPPKEYAWEDVFPVLDSHNAEDRPEFSGGGGGGVVGGIVGGFNGPLPEGAAGEIPEGMAAGGSGPVVVGGGGGGGTVVLGGGGGGGGTVVIGGGVAGGEPVEGAEYALGEGVEGGAAGGPTIIGGGVIGGGVIGGGVVGGTVLPGTGEALTAEDTETLKDAIQKMASAGEQLSRMAELTTATQEYLVQVAGISEQMSQLKETTQALNNVCSVLVESYSAISQNEEGLTSGSTGYVTQMEELNRNIGGLNTIYEIQLKSISSQLESIDRVNRGLKDIRDMYEKSANESSRYCEETEKMARYMKQLNAVYERMITAMTINMQNPLMGGGQAPVNPFAPKED